MRTVNAIVLLSIGLTVRLSAQDVSVTHPSSILIHTLERSLPSATVEYDGEQIRASNTRALLLVTTPVAFTSLAVAWSTGGTDARGERPILRVRSLDNSDSWTDWKSLGTETTPSETPSGLFWSELLTTADGTAHTGYEIRFPDGFLSTASLIRVMLVDTRDSRQMLFPERSLPKHSPLDMHPPIVPRSEWWGDLPPTYLNPTNYAPEYISISHAVVHHTAGVNNPPDPALDLRGIWYYHVFGQGWSDIAYNFLIDQFGTVYQGRYNPYIDLLDVRGSHATYANNQSVGISLLGTFSADTPPSGAAVESLTRVIAWRFQQKHLDPLARATMVMDQAGNTVNLYRVSGHRDISATACPGDALYAQLPMIRRAADVLIRSEDSASVPRTFALAQNYPNPFNPTTTIEYSLPEAGSTRLTVYDMLGRELVRLTDGFQSEGPHTVVFDGAQLSSGMYLYDLRQGSHSVTRRMMLIR